MGLIKSVHNLLEVHYKKRQLNNFIKHVRFAEKNKCSHHYFDEDEIDLILEQLYEHGYKIEKVELNQFRVSGW